MRVILASASPRRRELLSRLTYPFDVVPAHVDETRRPGEEPQAYARRVADDKARRVSLDHPGAIVLAADTIVVIDGEVLGKPADETEARAMLARLSDREHRVLTAVAWARGGELCEAEIAESLVRFRRLAEAEVADYVATGEPLDKAGAYAIQAGAASFVCSVEGSITNVIGLPLETTERTARHLGVPEVAAPLPPEAIALRLGSLRGELAGLAVARGRQARDVRLVAVSKGHSTAAAAAAIAAGATDLGENYVQEAVAKRRELGPTGGVRWHLIGPLQRNKAPAAARTFDVVHTIDRADVARALAARATDQVRALIQVNVTRDPAKSGVAPELAAGLLADLATVERLSVEGLMAIGPADASPEVSRAAFAELRTLLDRLRAMGYERLHELSMGMSDDYPVAIAQGATLVRIGTAVFGPRTKAPREGRSSAC